MIRQSKTPDHIPDKNERLPQGSLFLDDRENADYLQQHRQALYLNTIEALWEIHCAAENLLNMFYISENAFIGVLVNRPVKRFAFHYLQFHEIFSEKIVYFSVKIVVMVIFEKFYHKYIRKRTS